MATRCHRKKTVVGDAMVRTKVVAGDVIGKQIKPSAMPSPRKDVGDAIARNRTAGDVIAKHSGDAALRCHHKNKAVAAEVIAMPKTVNDAIA